MRISQTWLRVSQASDLAVFLFKKNCLEYFHKGNLHILPSPTETKNKKIVQYDFPVLESYEGGGVGGLKR